MAILNFPCPRCQAVLQLEVRSALLEATCPGCGLRFRVREKSADGRSPFSPAKIAFRLGMVLAVMTVILGSGIVLAYRCYSLEPFAAMALAAPCSAPEDIVYQEAAPASGVEKHKQKIKQALSGGIAYLKASWRTDAFANYWRTGAVALAALTLLECGVPTSDPTLVAMTDEVRRAAPTDTYSTALAVLFLDRLGQRDDEERIRSLALQLIAGQTSGLGWTYQCPKLTVAQEQDTSRGLAKRQETTPAPALAWNSNSVTQFAILALWVSRRHGLRTEPVLARAAARFQSSQNSDGSWGYSLSQNNTHRDSMTCAGLVGLALGRGDTTDASSVGKMRLQDPQIKAGLKFLSTRLGQTELVAEPERDKRLHEAKELIRGSPEQLRWQGGVIGADSMGDLYFLWSIERLAVLFDLEKIGEHDWYHWGSEIILAQQKADGGWAERFPGIPDTCFALLFLKRANLIKDLSIPMEQLALLPPNHP